MKNILLIIGAFGLLAGCKSGSGQVPPASPGAVVNLGWSTPTGCSATAPCTYTVYRDVITGTTCDPTTSTNWKQVTATPLTVTSYSDSTAAGLIACYSGETLQSGQNSAPSAVAGPFTVPGSPTAPAITGTVATAVAEKSDTKPMPTLASNKALAAPMNFKGEVTK